MNNIRKTILGRLTRDLIGPRAASEVLDDRPGDVYLTGILFPPRQSAGGEEDEDAEQESSSVEPGSGNETVSMASAMRPATCGISFAVGTDPGEVPAVDVRIRCGTYAASDKDVGADKVKHVSACWSRTGHVVWLKELILEDGYIDPIDLSSHGLSGLHLHIRTARWGENQLVTAVLSNECVLPPYASRQEVEQHSFFQTDLRITPCLGTSLIARPDIAKGDDSDSRSAALIYRDAHSYAVGHLSSATWAMRNGGINSVRTSWLPVAFVEATSAEGDDAFRALNSEPKCSPFSAKWLCEADDCNLTSGLERVAAAYESWIARQNERVLSLPAHLHEQAHLHLEICRLSLTRIRDGIAFLDTDADARSAFRLATKAMLLQRNWSGSESLVWRPFQLAFFLLSVHSSAVGEDKDRGTMDLLWFPTGGGKTEAYLLLTAFLVFWRRLKGKGNGGGGVAVLMRYTLRLLTVQQYERAAAMICACELIRSGGAGIEVPAALLSSSPISLGLWVGGDSTPNTVKVAAEALQQRAASTPAQLTKCPCCRSLLDWVKPVDLNEIHAMCTSGCALSRMAAHLPVWTVDEDVYRELPSLLIGTGDKFAQIVRKSETGRLFGLGTGFAAPELIIQDELHLISGPLGTMAGLYEIAIDQLCARNGIKPKIIGSTATIRRADSQIHALFDRDTFQFPPPGLDQRDSGFAVAANANIRPSRLYVGLTTAGRSAKFTLQAVTASLLQSATGSEIGDAERDYYWTLVAYFNSLRELGGALVLMQDDVIKTAGQYAGRREDEATRDTLAVTELTSRVDSSEIPAILARLDKKAGNEDAVDVVLASNMISVGIDVERLGIMVVNGQPKGIAEYIQATSRVGRGAVPGLVVTVFNANKARDRSHYETFRTWHQTLYRDVEATSVTPFAPRARDRALHAPLVALARHLVHGLEASPSDPGSFRKELKELVEDIVARALRIDPEEANAVRLELDAMLEDWTRRSPLASYWDDNRLEESLLMSAEKAAEIAAVSGRRVAAWPTPNSLRSVEASVEFGLSDGLKD